MMNLKPSPVFMTMQRATERNAVNGNLQCSNGNMSFNDFHANTANNGEVGHKCHEGELQELDLSLKL